MFSTGLRKIKNQNSYGILRDQQQKKEAIPPRVEY